ncbi:MAG: hypothetical protein HGA37_11005, partial [Lentimicrobium sp.]|nr:hypothetical protein [Lentimicrobium sp.]
TLPFFLAAQLPVSGPVAHYPLNGNAKEIMNDSLKGKSFGVTALKDRKGMEGAATSFLAKSGKEAGYIKLPIDISPKTFPVITICFWIKANETYKNMAPLNSGDHKTRGILTDYNNGAQRWSASAGKDDLICGSAVLKDQWTFIAVIYDNPNEQARLIVNNEVFGSRARFGLNQSELIIGGFNGQMDELLFFDRALTLNELESIFGNPITINAVDFAIEDRNEYRSRMAENRKSTIKPGDQFIVGYEELMIRDSVNSPNTQFVFKEGDSVVALKALNGEWLEVKNQQGQTGFIKASTLESNCYRIGNNKTIFRFFNWLGQIFQFNKFKNWLFVALFTVILVLAIRNREEINNWFSRIGRKDPREAYGSKSEGTPINQRIKFFSSYFPVTYPKWWMIAPGIMLGLMIIGGSLWDTGETEWFFNEGARLIPQGFTLPVHWVLWSISMIIILLIIALVLESLTIAGPFAGLLRIGMLFIINTMAVVVAFYISAGILIAIIGLIAFFIATMALIGRRRY